MFEIMHKNDGGIWWWEIGIFRLNHRVCDTVFCLTFKQLMMILICMNR